MMVDEMRNDVRFWQRLLRLAGYYHGKIDGIRGPLQRKAEAEWAEAEEEARRAHGDFDARTEANIATLIPAAQKAARAWMCQALAVAERLGVQVRIIGGTRTYKEQDELYAQGRTVSGKRVTNARGGYSWHNFGLAFDFGVFSGDGKRYIADGEQYAALGALARAVPGLEWGGDWKKFKDTPHIQLKRFESIAEARDVF